jgi:hypothetical protein
MRRSPENDFAGEAMEQLFSEMFGPATWTLLIF